MAVLAAQCNGSQLVQNFMQLGGSNFNTSFYLESCIWPDVMHLTKEQNQNGKSATETLEIIRKARTVPAKSKFTATEKGDYAKISPRTL
jgi:hypothetical protein